MSEKLDRSIEPDFPHSCSDGCYTKHTKICVYFKLGECTGRPDEYNYSCLWLYHNGDEQRFTRKLM